MIFRDHLWAVILQKGWIQLFFFHLRQVEIQNICSFGGLRKQFIPPPHYITFVSWQWIVVHAKPTRASLQQCEIFKFASRLNPSQGCPTHLTEQSKQHSWCLIGQKWHHGSDIIQQKVMSLSSLWPEMSTLLSGWNSLPANDKMQILTLLIRYGKVQWSPGPPFQLCPFYRGIF